MVAHHGPISSNEQLVLQPVPSQEFASKVQDCHPGIPKGATNSWLIKRNAPIPPVPVRPTRSTAAPTAKTTKIRRRSHATAATPAARAKSQSDVFLDPRGRTQPRGSAGRLIEEYSAALCRKLPRNGAQWFQWHRSEKCAQGSIVPRLDPGLTASNKIGQLNVRRAKCFLFYYQISNINRIY